MCYLFGYIIGALLVTCSLVAFGHGTSPAVLWLAIIGAELMHQVWRKEHDA